MPLMNLASPARPQSPSWSFRSAHVVRESIPAVTDLQCVAGRDVAIVLDIQNLEHSARDLGRVFDFDALTRALHRTCRRVALTAADSDDATPDRTERLLNAGFRVFHKQTVVRHGTFYRNADTVVAALVGLVAGSQMDVVLLGTGDGDLATDVARTLMQLRQPRRIGILGVPGSISKRLHYRNNTDIAFNVVVGDDLMRRPTPRIHG